jgi:type I restriction-modification system DNA methylase subunit
MPPSTDNLQHRQAVLNAIKAFTTTALARASTRLLEALGYTSEKSADLGIDAETFLSNIEQFKPDLGEINRGKVKATQWKSCAFLFQLTNDEIPSLAVGQAPLGADTKMARGQIESFVFVAIELKGDHWSRTDLAGITREINRRFPMPAIVIFRHGELLSLAVIDRRVNLRDSNRDVIDSRITVIKDVRLSNPHRAHLDILSSLALENLGEKRRPSNFDELYEAWIEALSTQKLNEDFYKKLAWWYLWAVKEARFPSGGGQDRDAIGVIRLLTRLIFVWFIKERGLVPAALFDANALKNVLKQAPDKLPEDGHYYHAILQNLFFATLNVEMGKDDKGEPQRRWAKEGSGMKGDYLISLVYRFQEAFRDPDSALKDCFANVPFLNGGLFECLDEALTDHDLERNPGLRELAVKEGNGWVLRIDGFSRRQEARAHVPNKLFFGGTDDAALNTEFETKGKRYPVKGLIDLLNSYKFTIDENTPLEEEVALDPELLGKVFENLLASYNPDTRSTARKQSGSFYTPREVVDYMVDEALIAYFSRHLPESESREGSLRRLLSHADTGHDFSAAQADMLVASIENLKVLDPACGSGAFPMGVLSKLFIALKKLDPDNGRWRQQNLAPLQQRLAGARKTPDSVQRDAEVGDAETALEKHKKDFADPAYADYTRKLYLIEKCIFGSDIQPIAVQIAKLRFFIALIVSQPIDRAKPNWSITPLPNLETKIVAANTLKGIPRQGVQGSLLSDPAIAEKEAELRDANAAYFTARTRATKKRRKEKVQKLHEELVVLLKRDCFVTAHDADRMARWDPFDQNRYADFFDVEWMFGMARAADNSEAVFDVIIGNPPYIKEFTFRDAFEGLRGSPYYQGKMDLWYMFACKALDQLKARDGVLSIIATNNWITNSGASILRRELAQRATILHLIDFMDYKVFGSADIQTMILIARNDAGGKDYKFDLRRLHKENADNHDRDALLAHIPAAGLEYLNPDFDREYFKSKTFTFSASAAETILNRMAARRNFVFDPKNEVAQGIVAPQDTVNKKASEALEGGAEVGEGIFVITEREKNDLNLSPEESELVRPYYTTNELARYRGDPRNSLWVIYTGSEFKSTASMLPYPNIKRHLDRFAKIITSDNAPYGLHRARDVKFFKGEKIVSLRKCDRPTFTFSDFDCYVSQTFNVIRTGRLDQRYLTALLNSSAISFWLRHRGKLQGQLFQIDKEPLLGIPLIAPVGNHGQIIAGLAASIIQLMAAEKLDLIPRFEQLINGLVFELFFPDDLHRAKIHLFDACEKAGIGKLATLKGKTLVTAAEELAARIFATSHPLYAMLFDLQALDVVRIVEGRD